VSHKLPPGFVYDRPVPDRWAEDLAQLAPKSDQHPWLLLAWLSGEPWEPVQRWCVYEMIPLRVWQGLIQSHRRTGKKDDEIIEAVILEELQGPHPRERGYFDTVLKRFVSEALVTRQEWELYHTHKAIPKLYWVIQGEHGGHKRVFSPLEQKYLSLQGLPEEPPAPGDLPYAEFDQRVLWQFAQRDRLQKLSGRLSPVEAESDGQVVELWRQIMQRVENQQRESLESVKLDLSGLPRSGAKEDDPTGVIEEAIDRYIQTGSSAPPPES